MAASENPKPDADARSESNSDDAENSPLISPETKSERPQPKKRGSLSSKSYPNLRGVMPKPYSADESSSLLQNQHGFQSAYNTDTSPLATRSGWLTPNNLFGSNSRRRPNHSRSSTLARKLQQAFGAERRRPWGENVSLAGSEKTAQGDERLWYDQFTSIDCKSMPKAKAGGPALLTTVQGVRDSIADAVRRKELGARRDIRGRLLSCFYGAQSWLCAALIGIFTALVAYLIDVTETTLFDYKFGYCKTDVFLRNRICCNGAAECDDWIPWHTALNVFKSDEVVVDFALFFAFMVVLATICGLLVLTTKTVIPAHATMHALDHGRDQKTSSNRYDRERRQSEGEPLATYYTASGSGVAEVRVILSGFIMHGYLGTKTLVVKTIGVVLGVASGLSVGKEGPYVHIATCIGNIISRAFPKYKNNDGKRREILSASAAAGVAVAFGSPIAGVLFSLEEVSYYFPAKTLFRTFFCSIIAAVALKFLDPYGTSKIVLFQVEYTNDWRFFELVVFIILGVLGGGTGALFIKASALWSRTFRKLRLIKKWPLLEVVFVAMVSGVASFWNRYTRLPVAELLFEVASECGTLAESGTGLCPSRVEMPETIRYLLIAFIVKTVLTIITFGIKVPSGIYVPSLVIGGLLGRLIGHSVQYLIMTFTESDVFGTCAKDGIPESCVVPGVYALVAAGATMCGVTRLSVTLAVMLFELTGSLDHVLPFSIAILTAKWTADALEPKSIYDLLTEMNSYPFLDNKTRPLLTGQIADITPRYRTIRTIDVSNSPLVQARTLRQKLEFLHEHGENDGALPILKDEVLIGLIPAPDLEFALDRLGDENQLCLISPHVQMQGNNGGEDEAGEDLTDFRVYVDPSPIELDIHSSMELAYELFAKLGLRYLCVLREGYYAGLVHKKAFVKYTREMKKHY